MLVDEELEPLGLVDEDDAPPVEDDEPAPVPLDEPMPPALLDEPPVPLGLELELEAESAGVLGEEDDEEDEPPGTTTVFSFSVVLLVDEDEPLGEVVVDPPGTTVVVSFFSHADSAKAPTRTNRYPLCFMFTLLSSEVHTQKRTAGLAINVPAPSLSIKDAPL